MDWLKEATKTAKEMIHDGIDIYGDFEKAVKYARENSTVGKAVFDKAVEEIRQEDR